MTELFRARVRAQLKLALLGDCGCLKTLGELESEARSSGLSGAEIDAALGGRSFGARTAAALSFACALKAGQDDLVEQARSRALRLGVTDEELRSVAEEAKSILASSSM